jgi:hypothetical protein
MILSCVAIVLILMFCIVCLSRESSKRFEMLAHTQDYICYITCSKKCTDDCKFKPIKKYVRDNLE